TGRPAPGVSLEGSAAAGNAIGDPGPFRYTGYASPNIDRIGPAFGASAAVAGAHTHARLFVRADEHHATDARIRERVYQHYYGVKQPRLFLNAFGLDAGTTGRLGTHRLYAAFSRFQDLPFVAPLGLEIPRDHRIYHAGV